MSKSTQDLKTHVASIHTTAFLALIKCSYVEADPALLCKNLPNFMGGSGTTLNLLGAKMETFGHPKTTIHTVGLLYSSKETLKGSRLIIACLGGWCKHAFFGGACVINSS